jgi:hypothetical protein
MLPRKDWLVVQLAPPLPTRVSYKMLARATIASAATWGYHWISSDLSGLTTSGKLGPGIPYSCSARFPPSLLIAPCDLDQPWDLYYVGSLYLVCCTQLSKQAPPQGWQNLGWSYERRQAQSVDWLAREEGMYLHIWEGDTRPEERKIYSRLLSDNFS